MKRRIFACLLALVMLVSVLPVALAADETDWTIDKENKTVSIYTADGLRAWANTITPKYLEAISMDVINHGIRIYDGYTINIMKDIDLKDENWTSILGIGGNVIIDGQNHTIKNMNISESENYGGFTFLGFIGHIAYTSPLTIKNLTFENAHVQDTKGDSYSWAAVVVGHGPMQITPDPAQSDCTFENVHVINSSVTDGHNGAAILGYAGSTKKGHTFKDCSVTNTFIGGYHSTSAILFSMGGANVSVENCAASGVLLYSDGLTFDCLQKDGELWLGYLYGSGKVTYSGTNTAAKCAIVYPVVFHYSNADIKEYFRVNTPLSGTWYAEEACVKSVTEIDGKTMYPKDDFVNDEAYGTQDTSKVANPLTHAVIHLYTKDEYDPNPPVNDYILPALWLNTKDHYSYLIGYADGTVKPEGKITRAEVATIFFRLLTDDARAKFWMSTNNYTDVPAGKWYNNAISTLSNMGVIGGYADGTFKPDAPISRAEFAKIAVSFSNVADLSYRGYFADVKESDWFSGFVAAAKDAGLIEGYNDGTFQPEKAITRAEVCTIVNRTLGRKPSASHMKISDRIDWPDVQVTDWYYEAIMEATNSHTYQMGQRVETWNDKLPQRDWALLETGWANAYTGNGGEVN